MQRRRATAHGPTRGSGRLQRRLAGVDWQQHWAPSPSISKQFSPCSTKIKREAERRVQGRQKREKHACANHCSSAFWWNGRPIKPKNDSTAPNKRVARLVFFKIMVQTRHSSRIARVRKPERMVWRGIRQRPSFRNGAITCRHNANHREDRFPSVAQTRHHASDGTDIPGTTSWLPDMRAINKTTSLLSSHN